MQVLIIPRDQVNLDALTATLRDSLRSDLIGVSVRSGVIVVFVTDTTSESAKATVRQLVQAHDAQVLTPEQASRLATRQQLQAARANYEGRVRLSDFAQSDADVQTLAGVVYRLALEVRALRDAVD
ncbi:MAG: hypothetical protein AAFQ07_04580 [Chloroflexota bacterium]